MLRLFQSIFGAAAERGQYPEALVQAAIERAVDGTDARLRALPGYQKKLRPAVLHAIDHVVALVEALPPPMDAARGSYGSEPRLTAFFASPEHMQQVFSGDRTLADFLEGKAGRAGRVIALLLMERHEKNVLGLDLEGEILKREVAQVTVSFAGHRLADPTAEEGETRRLLKRRAFDHLLTLALGRIAAAREERAELQRQQDLLRHKLRALQSGRWSFEASDAQDVPDTGKVEAQIEEIEMQLRALGADAGTLKVHLDMLIEMLARAEEQLSSKRIALIVDRMGIKRERAADTAPELGLDELTSANGRSLIVSLVSIPGDELRPRRDLFAEAQRYLG
jgi:hypothetical protein